MSSEQNALLFTVTKVDINTNSETDETIFYPTGRIMIQPDNSNNLVPSIDLSGNIRINSATFSDGTVMRSARNVGLNFIYNNQTNPLESDKGEIRFNNQNIIEASIISINTTDNNNNVLTQYIESFNTSTSSTKGYLYIHNLEEFTNGVIIEISYMYPIQNGQSYRQFDIKVLNILGSGISNNDELRLYFFKNGDRGLTGTTGLNGTNGYVNNGSKWLSGDENITPSAGKFYITADGTTLVISKKDINDNDFSNWFSTIGVGDLLTVSFKDETDNTIIGIYRLNSVVTQLGDLNAFQGSLTPLLNEHINSIQGKEYSISYSKKGDPGLQGIQGVKGDTGSEGPQGPVGPEGPEGPQGPAGVQGTKGSDGVSVFVERASENTMKIHNASTMPSFHAQFVVNDDMDVGLKPEGFLPGPNGARNAIPEPEINCMTWIVSRLDMTPYGGSPEQAVYIPAYWYKNMNMP